MRTDIETDSVTTAATFKQKGAVGIGGGRDIFYKNNFHKNTRGSFLVKFLVQSDEDIIKEVGDMHKIIKEVGDVPPVSPVCLSEE